MRNRNYRARNSILPKVGIGLGIVLLVSFFVLECGFGSKVYTEYLVTDTEYVASETHYHSYIDSNGIRQTRTFTTPKQFLIHVTGLGPIQADARVWKAAESGMIAVVEERLGRFTKRPQQAEW